MFYCEYEGIFSNVFQQNTSVILLLSRPYRLIVSGCNITITFEGAKQIWQTGKSSFSFSYDLFVLYNKNSKSLISPKSIHKFFREAQNTIDLNQFDIWKAAQKRVEN